MMVVIDRVPKPCLYLFLTRFVLLLFIVFVFRVEGAHLINSIMKYS